MKNIEGLLELLPDKKVPAPISRVVNLPYHLHWLQEHNSPKEFLEWMFHKKKVFYSYLHSGLGDRLFQYCSVYGMARGNKVEHRVFCSQGDKYLKYFQGDTQRPIPSYDAKELSEIIKLNGNDVLIVNNLLEENIAICVEPERFKHERYPLFTNKAYIFDGYFQNERYFYNYREALLERFKEPEYITKMFSQSIDTSNIICIHVKPTIKKVNLLKYYSECIKFAKETHPDCLFTIVSREKNLSKIYSLYHCLKGIPAFVNNTSDDLVDLYFMARCKGVICSNSTFAWWGAWFNKTQDKFVTLPSKWTDTAEETLQMCGAHVVSI